MRTVLKVLGWIATVFLVGVLGLLLWVWIAFPKSEPAPELTVAGTPAQIERGRYLFHNVSQCVHCHALHDTTRSGNPILPGTFGKEAEWEAPFFPPNLTPAALSEWSDGEIYRAISSGIREDGRALFPAMPYQEFGHMSREDLESVVAYVRTLEPIPVERARTPLGFPLSVIARIAARPAEPPARTPDRSDPAAYGEYLTSIAGCKFCHTADKALPFAGGHEFSQPGWAIRSANITPDSVTGLGAWTRERFVTRFKAGAVPADSVPLKDPDAPPTEMPWGGFSGLTEDDLSAIYAYLRTLPPTRNPVVRQQRVAVTE